MKQLFPYASCPTEGAVVPVNMNSPAHVLFLKLGTVPLDPLYVLSTSDKSSALKNIHILLIPGDKYCK